MSATLSWPELRTPLRRIMLPASEATIAFLSYPTDCLARIERHALDPSCWSIARQPTNCIGEITVPSMSAGRCDTSINPRPYFRPSRASLRIALWATSYCASPRLGTYLCASSQTEKNGVALLLLSILVEFVLKQQTGNRTRQRACHFVGKSRNVDDL